MAKQNQPHYIRRFSGIDRFSRGIMDDPSRFHALDGFHPVSDGELKAVGGHVEINPASLPGVKKVIHTDFHKDFGGKDQMLVFFEPDIDDTTDFGQDLITADLISGSGTGDTETFNFTIILYGPGGSYKRKDVSKDLEKDDLFIDLTIPDLPDFVCQVNVYQRLSSIEDRPFNYALIGSANRFKGQWPKSFGVDEISGMTLAVKSSSNALNRIDPTQFNAQPLNDGSLLSGKQYFFGISPQVVPDTGDAFIYRYPRVSLALSDDADDLIMSYVIPRGGKGAFVQFAFAKNWRGFNTSSNTYSDTVKTGRLLSAGEIVKKAWVFAGTTYEDVLLANGTPQDASDLGVTRTKGQAGFSTFDWSTTENELQITNSGFGVEDGSAIMFQSGPEYILTTDEPTGSRTPTPGGLSNDTVYWIRVSNKTFVVEEDIVQGVSVKFATSKANLLNNVFVNITSNPSPASGRYYEWNFGRVGFSLFVRNLPENSNNGVYMAEDTVIEGQTRNLRGTFQQGDADRLDGVFINSQFMPWGLPLDFRIGMDVPEYAPEGGALNVGCWVLESKNFSMETSRQLLANINDKSFSLTGINFYSSLPSAPSTVDPPISPSLLWMPADRVLGSTQFGLRTFIGNGDNVLFYTNGYVLKPIVPLDGSVRAPTSKYVASLGSRLIAGGGSESFQNSRNVVYYSEPDSPFDFGSGTPNFLTAFSQRDINGFGVYSQNLLDDGFSDFLLISKEDALFSWNGDTSQGARQIYYSFGMASPQSFIQTQYGPVIVARENVYTIRGDTIADIGDEVAPILKGLTEDQLRKVVAVYNNRVVKIGYPSGAGGLDREIWLELRTERGELRRIYSGPHKVAEYVSQASSLIFDGDREFRVAAQGTKLLHVDTGNTRSGDPIQREITFDRLGLRADQVRKLLTRLDLAVLVAKDETFQIEFSGEDGSSLYSGTLEALLADGERHWVQHFAGDRFRARVSKVKISSESDEALSIFEICLWHKVLRRQLLR